MQSPGAGASLVGEQTGTDLGVADRQEGSSPVEAAPAGTETDGRPPSAGPPRSLARRLAPHAAVVAVLLATSVGVFARVWLTGHPSSTVLCHCGDPGQAVWFMSWVPYAISHGHNPLFTSAILANEGGANLLQSTSYLLPSFVLAPVTWLFGPTASFNLAELLAPVLSGWAMWLALGRISRRWGSRAAGALLWAFSPFMLSHEIYGHLSLTLLYFPPLLFLLLHDLVADPPRGQPWRIGLLAGLLVVAQFFTGTEVLAITALAAVPALVVAAALGPRRAWAARRRVGIALAVAVGTAGVLLAYPIWFLVAGPQHVVGQAWPASSVAGSGIGGIVHIGQGAHSNSPFVQVGGYFGQLGPNSAYIGPGLLAFLAVSVAVWWRRILGWAFAVATGFSWLLSLGTLLLPLGPSSTPWWLLWKHFANLPLLESVLPQRFALAIAAFLCGLLAISLDGWMDLGARVLERSASGSRPAWLPGAAARPGVVAGVTGAVLTAGLVAAALPIAQAYTWPLTMNTGPTPEWFLTSAKTLTPGTEVLTYPYASSAVPDAMYWQAQDGLRFRLAGGRSLIPGADGRHSQHVSPFGGLDAELDIASYGAGVPAIPDATQVQAIRGELERWGVQVVVVSPFGRAPGWAAAVFTEALGRAPLQQHGSLAWYGLGSASPLRLSPGDVAPCIGGGQPGPIFDAAPACVMVAAAGLR